MKTNLSSARIRVLLVEESLPIRQRIRSLIEEAGPLDIVVEADTVASALVQFNAHDPDVVILDLGIADGDGGGVLAEIKRIRHTCVVIILSRIDSPECRDFCARLGADYFFDKNNEFERVPQVLAKLRNSLVSE